ncbi:vegetative cell wall protein gp1-like [Zingiber officinale]|uniref:vegetative cell wall protein gp1-like n=1 Tax=Zingiber officinale TaxID=94328 RepID=UPI001C4C5FFD|nr:vegetative cell wall protein gp1-like [Zingiber officinale]
MASPSFLPSLASILYPGSSSFDECARDDLRYTYGVEDDVQVIIPTGIHHFFNPPVSSSTFFREQFVADLRLPIHPFFIDIGRYFQIPLGQLTPNSIRILCGFVVHLDQPLPLAPGLPVHLDRATPACPRAPRTARPTPPTPLPSVSPPRATYIPGRGLGERLIGLGGGTGNVPFASPASREAYQVARRAHAANDRLSRNVSSPSRHRARSPSDDSDYDDQPLSQRRRRRAPRTMPDSGPSSISSPPAAASPSHVTPPSIPGHVTDPPTSPHNQAEPPLAQPSTSQHAHDDEAGPSERPSTIPPAVPRGPSSAPSGATAKPSAPSGLAAGPSGPPPLIYQNYCTTLPSEEQL